MKILFVDTGDPTDPMNWSGTPSNVVKEMQRKHEVVFCSKLNSFAKLIYLPYLIWCRLTKKQAQIFRHYIVAKAYAEQVRAAYRKHKPDIVFSMQSIPLAYLPADIPHVYWTDAIMHGMIDFYWSSADLHSWSQRAGKALDETALNTSGAAIYSSDWAAAGARQAVPGAASKVHTVAFGANNWPDDGAPAPKTLPIDGQPIEFLFIGGDFERKGGPAAIEAMRILVNQGRNVHLSIVGSRPFPDDQVPGFITQYGFLRRDNAEQHLQLVSLFKEAHAFILPSHAECTAIVFAEAASYGLPSIARAVGGTATMVHHGKTGLLIGPTADPDTLAAACAELISDPNRYADMSIAARKLFTDKLNWTSAVAEVVEILGEVARAHHSRTPDNAAR